MIFFNIFKLRKKNIAFYEERDKIAIFKNVAFSFAFYIFYERSLSNA